MGAVSFFAVAAWSIYGHGIMLLDAGYPKMLIRIAPALFVVFWSTGFIGTKIGTTGAEPFTFLAWRFLLVLGILIPLGLWLRPRVMTPVERVHAMIVGILMYALYIGGVMSAMKAGMGSNVAALIVSLQPVLTAVLAGIFLKETITKRQWFGIALGLIGAALVIGPRLQAAMNLGQVSGITPFTLVSTALALVGITLGTLYQKRFATGFDMLSGAIWQYVGALAVILPLATMFDTLPIAWTPPVLGAMAWLVLVVSIGTMGLLLLLIQQNSVSGTAGLFYLVPGVTALMSFVLFGETLNVLQLVGLVVVTVAVVLIQTKAPDRGSSDIIAASTGGGG